MKDYFLWAMAVIIPSAVIGYFLWKLGLTFRGMFLDWRLHRELDELQKASAAKKRAQDREPSSDSGAAAEPEERVDYTTRM